jgi:hypothetical protein
LSSCAPRWPRGSSQVATWGGAGFVAHDRGVASVEPSFDVLGASHQAWDDQLELVGFGTEVVPIGGDLAGQGALEPVEVVGAGRQVVLDRRPVGTQVSAGRSLFIGCLLVRSAA